MTKLEQNIQYLYYAGDVKQTCWLCIPLWKDSGIHVQVLKHGDSGEYIIRSLEPKFEIKGFDFRNVLLKAFDELRSLVNNSIRYSSYVDTVERVYDFIVRLKNSPRLF